MSNYNFYKLSLSAIQWVRWYFSSRRNPNVLIFLFLAPEYVLSNVSQKAENILELIPKLNNNW